MDILDTLADLADVGRELVDELLDRLLDDAASESVLSAAELRYLRTFHRWLGDWIGLELDRYGRQLVGKLTEPAAGRVHRPLPDPALLVAAWRNRGLVAAVDECDREWLASLLGGDAA